MATYRVLLYARATQSFLVEAENETEAGQIVWEGDGEPEGPPKIADVWELDEVQEVDG